MKEQICFLYLLFFSLTKLSAQVTMIEVEQIFQENYVFDLALNFWVRENPACQASCARSVYPGNVSGGDFSDFKSLSGIDAGSLSIASGFNTMKSIRHNTSIQYYKNGKILLSKEDLLAIPEGYYGIMFDVQKRVAPRWQLNGDINTLDTWFNEGLRMLTLAYGFDENHGILEKLGHATDAADNLGITDLGRQAITKMNALGMVIDVSHCNKQTTLDAASLSKKPIVSTHSNARGIRDISRNKTDEELIVIANTGGVIGITPICWMLDNPNNSCDLTDFVNHVSYLKNLIGIDHIGLATDGYIDGWETTSPHYPGADLSGYNWQKNVVFKLMNDKGFSQEDIQKLLGKNFLRVLLEVLPNDCQNAEDVQVTIDLSLQQTLHAKNTLSASNSIDVMSNIHYKAGETITLQPGFHAPIGSDFLASIAPCISSVVADFESSRLVVLDNGERIPTLGFTAKVYPNPVRDLLYIEVDKVGLGFELELFDLVGRRVYQQRFLENFGQVEVYDLEVGIYFLRVDGVLTQKVIIE